MLSTAAAAVYWIIYMPIQTAAVKHATFENYSNEIEFRNTRKWSKSSEMRVSNWLVEKIVFQNLLKNQKGQSEQK